MMFYVVFLYQKTKYSCYTKKCPIKNRRTLNAAEYGITMGKLAKTASALLALTPLNARLCVIS